MPEVEHAVNKTCLSYWFPLIRDAGLPVPKTEVLVMPDETAGDFWNWTDGAPLSPRGLAFVDEIRKAALSIGLPAFLRTGQGSGKHEWDRCCNLRDVYRLTYHVGALIEWSECVDFLGLPWDVWAVREMLPVMPFGVCPRYGNMPIAKEIRVFVENDRLLWAQPYWPLDALRQGGNEMSDELHAELCRIDDFAHVVELAKAAGRACGGKWSVDILDTERGWFVTDMAEAERSYGWDEERYIAGN